jgi:hypothetical protein
MTENPGRLPTEAEFDELLAFLNELYREGFEAVGDWGQLPGSEAGAVVMPAPRYHQQVVDFVDAASRDIWTDYEYSPLDAWQMLQDPERVAHASLEQVKSMLTYCVRGERFSDGHWARMIEGGYVRRLLERLAKLWDARCRE